MGRPQTRRAPASCHPPLAKGGARRTGEKRPAAAAIGDHVAMGRGRRRRHSLAGGEMCSFVLPQGLRAGSALERTDRAFFRMRFPRPDETVPPYRRPHVGAASCKLLLGLGENGGVEVFDYKWSDRSGSLRSDRRLFERLQAEAFARGSAVPLEVVDVEELDDEEISVAFLVRFERT
jgi:hypothetical protein